MTIEMFVMFMSCAEDFIEIRRHKKKIVTCDNRQKKVINSKTLRIVLKISDWN